ncbi:MAG: hypothetical protein AAGK22_23860 [Acidobacteriota bacterium]
MDPDYFRTIEETFVELRGAPLLLSPEDWQIARGWYERGLPSDFVVAELRKVFERRREMGERSRVHRLKYLAPAVEEAWREREELLATGARGTPTEEGPDLDAALKALADRLPQTLGDRRRWQGEILALRRADAEAETIEQRLQEIETRVLRSYRDGLPADARKEIETAVSRSLEVVRERLSKEQEGVVRRRLGRRMLRERLGLPRLSLIDS